VPAKYAWPTLLALSGDALFDHYRHILDELGKQKGTLGLIFGKAQNKFQDPAKLTRVIADLIDKENWSALNVDVKGDAYEGLLEKNAQDTKSGAGQYFTPRALIQAMVSCVAPKPGERICDPACGTGGFLFMAHNYIVHDNRNLTRDQQRHLRDDAFSGWELVQATARVCAMNLMLHGIGSETRVPLRVADALAADPGERYDVVLANPPFGGKQRPEVQQNFPIRTGETAFLFLQHFIKILKAGGRAGIVIKNTFLSNTDNASVSLRKLLLESCNLHTVLDCPSGTFQGAGVGTVVLFFKKGSPTHKIWFYQLDPGSNLGKTNPLNDDDLVDFLKLQRAFADSAASWSVDVATLDQESSDLSVKNPHRGNAAAHRTPAAILDEIAVLLELQYPERTFIYRNFGVHRQDNAKTVPGGEAITRPKAAPAAKPPRRALAALRREVCPTLQPPPRRELL
jgi:type I restriction enzyme M protein